jgi:hypothetical protein
MWNMAIVAMGMFPVGAVGPGNKLWSHYMAVGTGFRLVGEIGGESGDVHCPNNKASPNAQKDQHINLPAFRRLQAFEKTSCAHGFEFVVQVTHKLRRKIVTCVTAWNYFVYNSM